MQRGLLGVATIALGVAVTTAPAAAQQRTQSAFAPRTESGKVVTQARAQSSASALQAATGGGGPSFSIMLDANKPTGDLGDFFGLGFGGEVGVMFHPASLSGLGIGGTVGYQRLMGKSTDNPFGGGSFEVEDGNLITGTADVRYAFTLAEGSSFRPFVGGGAGIYRSSGGGFSFSGDGTDLCQINPDLCTDVKRASLKQGVSLQDGDGGNSSTDFGFRLGGGVDFNLSGFATFLQAMYNRIQVEGGSANFITIGFGARFGGGTGATTTSGSSVR